MSARLSSAVVVCAAAREREHLLHACVASLLEGTRVPDEISRGRDGNPALEASVATWLPGAVRLLRGDGAGISASRNVGLRAARSEVVAFVDDDAAVAPDWLARLLEQFEACPDLLGAGGGVEPHWGDDRRWLPDELLWVVGCTYAGHREDPGPIRNPIGCNMAFRRRQLAAVGGFSPDFGKRGSSLSTCDETELGLRMSSATGPGGSDAFPPHVFSTSYRALGSAGGSSRFAASARDWRRVASAVCTATRRSAPSAPTCERLVTRSVPRMLVRGIVRRDRSSVLGAAAIRRVARGHRRRIRGRQHRREIR